MELLVCSLYPELSIIKQSTCRIEGCLHWAPHDREVTCNNRCGLHATVKETCVVTCLGAPVHNMEHSVIGLPEVNRNDKSEMEHSSMVKRNS